jgi:hypothetical protein
MRASISEIWQEIDQERLVGLDRIDAAVVRPKQYPQSRLSIALLGDRE